MLIEAAKEGNIPLLNRVMLLQDMLSSRETPATQSMAMIKLLITENNHAPWAAALPFILDMYHFTQGTVLRRKFKV
jgi:hypothetical protein